MARGLKRGRNRLIGMLVADLQNPYSIEVLQGVEAACHQLGFMLMICNAANEAEMERRYLQLLATYRVEGVIVNAIGVREEILRPVGADGLPAVLIDRRMANFHADIVGLDNASATALGMRHLAEAGFDTIHLLVEPFEQVSSRAERVDAFTHAVATDPRLRGDVAVIDLADAQASEARIAALVGAPGAVHASNTAAHRSSCVVPRVALLSANAPVAMRAALTLQRVAGSDWQQRIGLLSFDDPDWATLAGITTIRQPTYEIGYCAVEYLRDRIEGATMPARERVWEGVLIERMSTRRIDGETRGE
jgi:LacI family kdg operon repressor